MRHLILILGLVLIAPLAWCQALSDTAAIKAINAKNARLPTEHIYLHLNKPRYERADTIWLRAYVVNEAHRLSGISGAAYVELISPEDTVIQKLSLKLEDGMASGDFALPMSLETGKYHLRAYTNWMLNEPGNVFDREVVIGNPVTPPKPVAAAKPEKKAKSATAAVAAVSTASNPARPDVQFFPEGGELVGGLRNVVAYKGINPDGSAATFKGTITGTDGQTLAELESDGGGTGIFALSPQAGENYTAKLTFANGSSQTVTLPKVTASGYLLSINNRDKDTLTVRIAASADLLKTSAGQPFYLTAQSGGRIYYTTSGKADATAYRVKIAKNRFPTGIVRFTLYSATGDAMNERVAFIQQADNLNLQLKPNAATGEQSLGLVATAQKDKAPSVGSFSAAVFNEDKVPFNEQAEPTIFSTLLLSDELHGKIADAARYFTDAGAMDLLMLTQGYRKLERQNAQDGQTPKFRPEDGLTISGTVTTAKGKPVTTGKVTLFCPQLMMHADTTLDAGGRFVITNLDIAGNVAIVLKAESGAGTDLKIVLDEPDKRISYPAIEVKDSVSRALAAALQQSYQQEEKDFQNLNSRQLKEVTIKESYDPHREIEKELVTSANLNGPGHADQVILGKDLQGCTELITCLIGKLAFVTIQGENIYDVSRGGKRTLTTPIPMTIMVNGAIGARLADINPNDVYSIEVLTSTGLKAIYGHDAAGGLLLITTKRGIPGYDALLREKAPGLISFTYNGYYKAREFYHPKYQQGDAYQPAAIYWKPDILTDKDGKATINFNNAGKGHYRVVVEGIDGEGRLGHAEYKYEVK